MNTSVHPPSVPLPTEFLPNFCTNYTVFVIVIIAELLALVLTLSRTTHFLQFWTDLAFTSLFIQWVALSIAAVLCFANRWLNRQSELRMILLIYLITQFMTGLFSVVTIWIDQYTTFNLMQSSDHLEFVIRNILISSIIVLVALHYFYVQHQWQKNLALQAQAKLAALQARIHPHFLFNTLNTAASLIPSQPDKAEQTVLDLADLFRSALEQTSYTLLKDELETIRRYLRIETLRLGNRLAVDWQLADDLPLDLTIPALLLQPLVENAVYHGIQLIAEGGCITISGCVQGSAVCFTITNPISPNTVHTVGKNNHLAQKNIAERLKLTYGDRGRLTIQKSDQQYCVHIEWPLERQA